MSTRRPARSRFRSWRYRAWHFHIKPELAPVAKAIGYMFGFLIPAAVVFAAILMLAGIMRLIDWLSWP